jgi:hypothetical protein
MMLSPVAPTMDSRQSASLALSDEMTKRRTLLKMIASELRAACLLSADCLLIGQSKSQKIYPRHA